MWFYYLSVEIKNQCVEQAMGSHRNIFSKGYLLNHRILKSLIYKYECFTFTVLNRIIRGWWWRIWTFVPVPKVSISKRVRHWSVNFCQFDSLCNDQKRCKYVFYFLQIFHDNEVLFMSISANLNNNLIYHGNYFQINFISNFIIFAEWAILSQKSSIMLRYEIRRTCSHHCSSKQTRH